MFDQAFIDNPYPHYHRWMQSGHILWSEDFLRGAWVVPGYADLKSLLLDNERLSTEKAGDLVRQFPPEYRAELQSLDDYVAGWLSYIDPPRHLRIRRLLQKGFTLEVLESFRPRVRRIANELLDAVIARGDGRMDVIADLSHKLPVRVVGMMLGIPDEDHARFLKWMEDLAGFIGAATSTVEAARIAKDALDAMTAEFRRLLAGRRGKAGDDLMSILLAAEEEGDILREEELYAQCLFFMFAGHETTSNLIGNGLLCLLKNPDQLDLLRGRPGLLLGAVEETLRFEAPFQFTFRKARTDIELFGQPVKKGEAVILPVGCANRDPAVFTDPDRFDITRDPNPQIGFGYGIHHCIGAATARMEAEVALQCIFERMGNLRSYFDLSQWRPEWQPVLRFRGIKSLPIAYEPAALSP